MLKLNYVEDYLELIAGFRDTNTGKLDKGNINYMLCIVESPIKLARYDVNVITNMVSCIQNNMGLTLRQSTLACKIILKYERQWSKMSVDVSPVKNPEYRLPIRPMDYSKRLTWDAEKNCILVRFPFEESAVNEIREFSKTSQGSVVWNRDLKSWQSAVTEYNVNWLYTWAHRKEFDIDDQIVNWFKSIQQTESQIKPLTLLRDTTDSEKLYISQAPDSLIAYLQAQSCELTMDNILFVIDKCAELGVTVSNSVLSLARDKYPEIPDIVWQLSLNREIKTADKNHQDLIFQYADQFKKWPMVIYEPDLSYHTLQWLLANRSVSHITDIQNQESLPWNPDTRYVYTTKPIKSLPEIPLLLSKAGMHHGPEKLTMLERSCKIVYNAPEVYRKHSTEVYFLAS